MGFRLEKEIDIFDNKYKIRQLPATKGIKALTSLISIITRAMQIVIDAGQGERGQEIIQKFLGESNREEQVNLKTKISSMVDGETNYTDILEYAGMFLTAAVEVAGIIDDEKFEELIHNIVADSIILYNEDGGKMQRPEDDENFFDNHFAGNYEILFDLFAFLTAFNFSKSIKALKKSKNYKNLTAMFQPDEEKES
jgi:hypothetical protein